MTNGYISYAAYGSKSEAARLRACIEGGGHPSSETMQPGCANREIWAAAEPLPLPVPLTASIRRTFDAQTQRP